MRGFAGQHKPAFTGGFFQGFQNRIGRDMVHALRGIDQHHFGVATRSGVLGEVNHFAHCVYANFFAGFSFIFNLFLRLFVQRPIQFKCYCLRHEHT